MDKPFLDLVTFRYSQEGNTDGTTGLPETDGWEELIIEMQGAVESLSDGPGYLVLRIKTGWSINDPAELTALLDNVRNIFKNNKNE
jgi:hypothetical protein